MVARLVQVLEHEASFFDVLCLEQLYELSFPIRTFTLEFRLNRKREAYTGKYLKVFLTIHTHQSL